jgi:hypothetical protein
MDELEIRMRDVLLQLAMTSNGRTTTLDSSGVGTADYVLVDDSGRAKLARGDAPHLTFAELWDLADDDHGREQVLKRAKDELDHIRKSHADPTKIETKDQLSTRIVREGAGFPAKDVAIAMRTGVTVVWKARQAVGRDIEFGELLRGGRELSLEEQKIEVIRLKRTGLSQRQIALRLNITHASVRYVLARQK